MKKITLLFIFFLGLTSITADAQVTPGGPKSAEVALNIKLHPIQTIIVNSLQKTVNVEFTTAQEYSDGVTVTQNDHLNVYSTGAFEVAVKSTANTIGNNVADDPTTIESNTIKVLASQGSSTGTAVTGDTTFNEVSLTDAAQPLITSTTGGINRKFNVAYKAMGNNDTYINKHVNLDNVTVYSTTVTYSIVTK